MMHPEEKVRASYFCELVLDYDYPTKNIDIEVIVPRRTPKDRADIVVYDEKEAEYLVVECKKDGITDAEFKQAIEQAFGNANSLRAKFASVVAGTTKTAFDVAGFKPNEREKNVTFFSSRIDRVKITCYQPRYGHGRSPIGHASYGIQVKTLGLFAIGMIVHLSWLA